MKKLVMAVAIVCAAVASQAATVSWTLTDVTEGGKAVSGCMYFMASEVVSKTSFDAIAGTGATAMQKFFDDNTYAFAWTVKDGVGTMSTSNESRPSNADLGLTDSTTYKFYAVVFDTATITDSSNYYVTDLKSVKVGTGTANKPVGFGSQASAIGPTSWSAVNAPEPTSGLLLLIGMAGLALRRRRA